VVVGAAVVVVGFIVVVVVDWVVVVAWVVVMGFAVVVVVVGWVVVDPPAAATVIRAASSFQRARPFQPGPKTPTLTTCTVAASLAGTVHVAASWRLAFGANDWPSQNHWNDFVDPL
jgi:hypothetical protein